MKSKKKQSSFKEITKQDVERVSSLLNEYHISAYVNANYYSNTLYIDIEWGDWKHDHLCCDKIMEEEGFSLIDTKFGESDGDCYNATHTYAKL